MKEPNLHELFRYLRNIFLCFVGVSLALYIAYILHAKPFVVEPWSQESLVVTFEDQQFTLNTRLLATTQKSTVKENPSLRDFVGWIGFGYYAPIRHINEQYLARSVDTWEQTLDLNTTHEGSLTILNGEIQAIPPKQGENIDTESLAQALEATAKLPDEKRNYEVKGAIIETEPKTSQKMWNEHVETIQYFLDNEFSFVSSEFNVVRPLNEFERSHLIELTWNTRTEKHELVLSEPLLQDILEPYNRPPIDATFEIYDTYFVRVVPSQTGLRVDIPKTIQATVESIQEKQTSAPLTLIQEKPSVTKEDLESLGVKHLVSSFTTYFSCCESRAKNIQNIANIVDGAVIESGETWNLNTFVGKRTEDRGFLPAGTIIKGSMIDTVGGGISQFATTFYNTLYWGGFQDVSHTPHSRYFSRYPEGIEATISWPEPHLVFKNNKNHAIFVKTKMTDTSVTIQFFGDNDGRILTGKHRDGKTTITIVDEGGENAEVVTSQVENKTEIYPPKEIYYTDSLLQENAIYTKSQGRPSYSVDITRTISNKQGETLRTKQWKTFYLSEDKEFLVHSCQFAPEGSLCKTKEDMEKEKEELEAFFLQLEEGLQE